MPVTVFSIEDTAVKKQKKTQALWNLNSRMPWREGVREGQQTIKKQDENEKNIACY